MFKARNTEVDLEKTIFFSNKRDQTLVESLAKSENKTNHVISLGNADAIMYSMLIQCSLDV